MAATAKKDNLRFIAIVLGEENSNTRNQEVMSLLDYGFNHYQMNLIKSKDEVLQTIPLDKANKESMSLVAISDIGVLSEKTATKREYDYDIKLKKYSLPVKPGDIVGEVIVKENNKEVTSVPVTVSESVSRLSFLELFGRGFIDLVSGDFTFSFD